VGALAVKVAITFSVILSSVALKLGVGGTVVGVTLGAQAARAKRIINPANNIDARFIVTSPGMRMKLDKLQSQSPAKIIILQIIGKNKNARLVTARFVFQRVAMAIDVKFH